MNTPRTDCIVLFVKFPMAGKVKTRLAAEIGDEAVVGLYKCFVEDLLFVIDNVDSELRLGFHPPEALSQLRLWLGDKRNYLPQKGNNLGEKMKNAFVDIFDKGFTKAVIIGSDIPDLPGKFVKQAFTLLDSNDAVIGPSSDGGYYLIGFSRDSFLTETFDDITWSTSAVLEQTLARLKSHGLKVHLLPQWLDVDTRADLDDLASRNGNTDFGSSKTFTFMQKILSQSTKT